ncbi:MAG TPA: hypothetical protein PKX48_09615 [Planctomycetota bacterium]|nr:DUF4440 domain-containing protein [Planctomycetota bacterium]OQC19615.1 MAG: hypothetical protein BWX69_02615 [Planctomycetes bacterium ADurb.Bin069]HNR99027.1 hypothetical protein [Planctomycetota bacterium]HNU27257.1 hypothetical protein [Planctomycetota bacterium]HOE30220.1 hypothetical protein [Planctomycetota bacterium]
MSKRGILLAVGAVVLIYGAYRGIGRLARSEEGAVRAVIDDLAAAFKEGAANRVLDRLTDDFAVTYRRERLDRRELAEYLRYTFLAQQERIELRGGLNRVAVAGDSASVVWEGRAVKRKARRENGGVEMHRGTVDLKLRKIGGAWLLAAAAAAPAEDH